MAGLGGGAIPTRIMRADQARRDARRRDPTARKSAWEPDAEVGPLLGVADSEGDLTALVRSETRWDLAVSTLALGSSITGTLGAIWTVVATPELFPLAALSGGAWALLALWAARGGRRVLLQSREMPSLRWHALFGDSMAVVGNTLGMLWAAVLVLTPIVAFAHLALTGGLSLGVLSL